MMRRDETRVVGDFYAFREPQEERAFNGTLPPRLWVVAYAKTGEPTKSHGYERFRTRAEALRRVVQLARKSQ